MILTPGLSGRSHLEQKTVDEIGEWLHLFMTYVVIRADRYPEEGSQLMTYILTMHAQKGHWLWLECDYHFRVRRERTDTPWNLINYPSTPALKQNICLVNMLPETPDDALPVSLLSLTRENVKDQIADTYIDVPSAKSNALLIQGRFTRSGSVISIKVKPNVLQFMLQGYDTNITKTLVTGFTKGFRIPSTITSDPSKHHIENHKSVMDNQGTVQRKMSKANAKHRIAGPFSSDPFPNMVYSPLGLKPCDAVVLTPTRNISEWNQSLPKYSHKATDYTRSHTDTGPDCFCFISTTIQSVCQPLTPAVMITPTKGQNGTTATMW